MQTTDKELLARYRRGEVAALEQLVARHRRMLYGYIVNMTESRNDADDIFQEVWLRVIRGLRGYRHRNFAGWLVRIAHNAVIDRARKRKPDLTLDGENEDGKSMVQQLPGDDPGPGRRLANRELGRRIKEAVARLPLDQREVFLMRTQAELSFKEIARIQKVSINTTLARMQYALNKMRPLLRDAYTELAER